MKKTPMFQLEERADYDEDQLEDMKYRDSSAIKDDLFESVTQDNFSYIRYKNYDLHLIKKKEIETDRQHIPATQLQRLSYFRYFCCSPIKQQINSHKPAHFLTHLWRHVYRNMFEHLPHLYTIIFLSVYAPHQHFYSSKMIPLFWGCTLQIIMCGFFEMAFFANNLTLLLDYVVFGIIYRGPWNRCKNATYRFNETQINCYKYKDFIALDKQNVTCKSIETKIFFNKNGSIFQSAQILYYNERRRVQFPDQTRFLSFACVINIFFFYYCLIWITAPFFHRQLFKKFFWKFYHYLFIVIFALYVMSLLYIEILFYADLVKDLPQSVKKQELAEHAETEIEEVTLERYGEILIAPPVVHLIHSRSKSEIKPGRHSALLMISIGIFFIFQEMFYARLKSFCDAITGLSLQSDEANSYPFYFLWPIFFQSFPIGSILGKIFFTTLFLLEYMTFVITYQCMVETVISEWKKLKWWMMSIILTVLAIVYRNVVTNQNAQIFFYMIGAAMAAITEIVVVYWLYPAGRLIEDINFFYYANSLTKLRKIFIQVMPIMFMIAMVINLRNLTKQLEFREMTVLIGLPFLPILLGFLYRVVWVYVKNKPCKSLIRPLPSWGPQDHVSRMFRKRFDERKFIDSLSDRFLSRQMLKNAEPPNYQLGVQFESFRKRSTLYSVTQTQ